MIYLFSFSYNLKFVEICTWFTCCLGKKKKNEVETDANFFEQRMLSQLAMFVDNVDKKNKRARRI